MFLWRSSCPAVLCVRTSWRIRSLPAVDTGSADSASAHTGTSLLHQDTPPVPSVEKDPEPELDCRQPVRAALYKVNLNFCISEKQGLTSDMSHPQNPRCCVRFCFPRPPTWPQIRHNSDCVNCQCEKSVKVVTKLMLMLAQVNGFLNSHCQTLLKHSTVHPKQVEYDDSLWRWFQMIV